MHLLVTLSHLFVRLFRMLTVGVTQSFHKTVKDTSESI